MEILKDNIRWVTYLSVIGSFGNPIEMYPVLRQFITLFNSEKVILKGFQMFCETNIKNIHF